MRVVLHRPSELLGDDPVFAVPTNNLDFKRFLELLQKLVVGERDEAVRDGIMQRLHRLGPIPPGQWLASLPRQFRNEQRTRRGEAWPRRPTKGKARRRLSGGRAEIVHERSLHL